MFGLYSIAKPCTESLFATLELVRRLERMGMLLLLNKLPPWLLRVGIELQGSLAFPCVAMASPILLLMFLNILCDDQFYWDYFLVTENEP